LSEDDSDIGDIPFKKPETKQQAMAKGKGGRGKPKGKAEPIEDVSNAIAEDDEDEDMDADEYVLHRQDFEASRHTHALQVRGRAHRQPSFRAGCQHKRQHDLHNSQLMPT